jgi:cysteinyl-tRNA synthetase
MKVFNTLSGQKEEFVPQSNTVAMYVCGVTVYDDCHIGHAMSYVIFDTIKRYLEFKGYKLKHVQNFTDIDDKIINKSRQLGVSAKELAEKYIAEYFRDMDALNIKRADIYPKATEEVPIIIEMIQRLVANGYAYQSQGSVYFRVNRFPSYGKLSRQNKDDMVAKVSADVEEKESSLDFALWKAAKEGEVWWPSPWGNGRPGWHIECSAMSVKYLGNTIDIHGGGQDLIFPHHENEITQSESYTGKVPFAKYWIHNGLLQFSGDKMSKSLGNLVTVKEALKRFSVDAIRLFILSSHYRSPLTYSEENIIACETGIQRLRQAVAEKSNTEKVYKPTLDSEQFRRKFIEKMDDDFNTAQAIGVLFDLVREINRGHKEEIDVSKAQQTLVELATTLGFTLKEPERAPLETDSLDELVRKAKQWQEELALSVTLIPEMSIETPLKAESLVNQLIEIRKGLRMAKQWHLADIIRNGLSDLGIILEDTPKGTTWHRSR